MRLREEDKNRPRFEKLGDVLERVYAQRGMLSPIREHELAARWEEVVGEKLARRVQKVRVEGGILWLRADGPQWIAEVSLRKRQLLEKLNALGGKAGEKVLTDIRFVGAWERRK